MSSALKVLPTGVVETEQIVNATMASLRRMMCEEPLVFIQLVQHCRYYSQLQPTSKRRLNDIGFLDKTGRVYQSIINIVMAVVKGDDANLELIQP